MKRMWIGGQFSDSVSGRVREVRDPANGEVLDGVPEAVEQDVDAAVSAAAGAFAGWSRATANDRAGLLHEVANRMREHQKTFVQVVGFAMDPCTNFRQAISRASPKAAS